MKPSLSTSYNLNAPVDCDNIHIHIFSMDNSFCIVWYWFLCPKRIKNIFFFLDDKNKGFEAKRVEFEFLDGRSAYFAIESAIPLKALKFYSQQN